MDMLCGTYKEHSVVTMHANRETELNLSQMPSQKKKTFVFMLQPTNLVRE
jgi:hypothetical protein